MSDSLPQEMIDLIIDNLRGEPKTLKSCSIVSKSWAYRTRKHLFNHVVFRPSGPPIGQWKETFPDPTISPAHNTRTLSIYFPKLIAAAEKDTLLNFCCVTRLDMDTDFWYDQKVSLVPLHGFSPILKSLSLTFDRLPRSEVFDLICSFPLLEDLRLACYGGRRVIEMWEAPSISPRLTGALQLRTGGGMQFVLQRLLYLPNGIHFRKIAVQWIVLPDLSSTVDLVSRCATTLKSLKIANHLEGLFLSRTFRPIDNSPLCTDESRTTSLDLSRVESLEKIAFICKCPSAEWVLATLPTIETKSLRQISLVIPHDVIVKALDVESTRRGWLDLDRMLVQTWTSRSIRPRLMYERILEERDLGKDVARLLPESMERGTVDVLKYNGHR